MCLASLQHTCSQKLNVHAVVVPCTNLKYTMVPHQLTAVKFIVFVCSFSSELTLCVFECLYFLFLFISKDTVEFYAF